MNPTNPTIDEWLAAGRMADGNAMTDERLSHVFDLVLQPGEHWKGPIAAKVSVQAATRAELQTAVAWHTGGSAEVEPIFADQEHPPAGFHGGEQTGWWVEAPGYWASCG